MLTFDCSSHPLNISQQYQLTNMVVHQAYRKFSYFGALRNVQPPSLTCYTCFSVRQCIFVDLFSLLLLLLVFLYEIIAVVQLIEQHRQQQQQQQFEYTASIDVLLCRIRCIPGAKCNSNENNSMNFRRFHDDEVG